jgi:hypothetical protein
MNFVMAFVSVLTNPAALLMIALAYTTGHFRGASGADQRCDTAGLKAQIATLELDRKAAEAASKRFEAEALANAAQAENDAKIIREITNDPKRTVCRLSDSDVRRVYSIR